MKPLITPLVAFATALITSFAQAFAYNLSGPSGLWFDTGIRNLSDTGTTSLRGVTVAC